eukprot:11169518-Lingulodinium_polyedra.AAC.1
MLGHADRIGPSRQRRQHGLEQANGTLSLPDNRRPRTLSSSRCPGLRDARGRAGYAGPPAKGGAKRLQ